MSTEYNPVSYKPNCLSAPQGDSSAMHASLCTLLAGAAVPRGRARAVLGVQSRHPALGDHQLQPVWQHGGHGAWAGAHFYPSLHVNHVASKSLLWASSCNDSLKFCQGYITGCYVD